MENKDVIVKGVLTSARIGTTKFDDKEKNRLSIKSDNLPYEELDEAYKGSGSRLTPKWLKDRTGFINLSSKFDIPVKDLNGRKITFEELCEKSTVCGSEVLCSIVIKEGCVYPQALMVVKEGEERDPFAAFDN